MPRRQEPPAPPSTEGRIIEEIRTIASDKSDPRHRRAQHWLDRIVGVGRGSGGIPVAMASGSRHIPNGALHVASDNAYNGFTLYNS